MWWSVHDLVYHRARKNISPLPPVLLHFLWRKKDPLESMSSGGVPEVLLWFSMAMLLHINVSEMKVHDHAGEK